MPSFYHTDISWEINPEDVHESGTFNTWIKRILSSTVRELSDIERKDAAPQLAAWEKELGGQLNLQELFDQATDASRILYISTNLIVSSNLLQIPHHDGGPRVPRILHPIIKENLQNTESISFIMPARRVFAGYRSDWGFIRLPTKRSSDGVKGAVLQSLFTVDGRVMNRLQQFGFQDLLTLFNNTFNLTTHDFIHHLSPDRSFAFSRVNGSPFEKFEGETPLDVWNKQIGRGKDPRYERWANLIHIRSVQNLLDDAKNDELMDNAMQFFGRLKEFQDAMQRGGVGESEIRNIGAFMLCIFIQPHFTLYPYPPGTGNKQVEAITNAVNESGIRVPDPEGALFDKIYSTVAGETGLYTTLLDKPRVIEVQGQEVQPEDLSSTMVTALKETLFLVSAAQQRRAQFFR